MSNQLEASMEICSLESLVARARVRPGYMGIAVWNQYPNDLPRRAYVAGCIASDGEICDPRSQNDHNRIEDALADLAAVMDRTWTGGKS